MRLEGSVVLVTGANGGIGRAFVVELPKRGRPKSISATFVHAIGAAFVRSQAFRRSVSGIFSDRVTKLPPRSNPRRAGERSGMCRVRRWHCTPDGLAS